MSGRPTHSRRRAVRGLTPRQREVLELLARGYTNTQIAERLGISLDGAKFHVREIFSRLEVASREEAVEAWHQRERLAALRHLGAGLALHRVPYIAGATTLAVATALFAIVFLFTRGDEGPAVAGAGIYVAVIEPAPGSDFYTRWPAPLRVLEVTTGREESFGPPAQYVDVAWAPDGSQLAALGIADISGEDFDIRLRTWNRDGELLHEAKIPPLRFVGEIAWSPDSSRIALLGAGIMILDAEATELGWFPAPPRAGGGWSGQGAPARPWSPDSTFVATVGNELLLLADRDGRGSSHELPADFTGSHVGWVDERLHLLKTDPAGWFERFGTITGDVLTWTDAEPAQSDPLEFPDQETLTELNGLVPGRRFAGIVLSSLDGATTAYVLSEQPGQQGSDFDPFEPLPASLVIRHGDEQAVVDLGPVRTPLGESFLDLVAVPGWSGPLPETLDAVTPLPDLPSPTPRRSPTRFIATEVPVTPRPYPTPTGDLVAPQLAGLPVLPGAVEVDGFTRRVDPLSDVEETVQVYATSASQAAVISFYRDELVAAGFNLRSSGGGPNGQDLTFSRGKDSVLISTRYVPRPDDPHADDYPPYGYLGEARWNLEFEPGRRYFFVVTLRAP